MNSMIYVVNDFEKVHDICDACVIDYVGGDERNNDMIPIYSSEEKAIENGWRKIDGIYSSSQDKEYVWVCPDCSHVDYS